MYEEQIRMLGSLLVAVWMIRMRRMGWETLGPKLGAGPIVTFFYYGKIIRTYRHPAGPNVTFIADSVQ